MDGNCEPTYEELKLTRMGGGLTLKPIASLPMRNWNVDKSVASHVSVTNCEPTYEELKLKGYGYASTPPKELRAYLWGIETLFQ